MLFGTTTSTGEKRGLWKYQPIAFEKAPCGYVGLKNLGATCYMNSLMQQLFMIPGFRWGLFEVPDLEMNKEESLLWQLQTIFSYLQESEKKYYDTRPFCSSYKDWEGQVRVMAHHTRCANNTLTCNHSAHQCWPATGCRRIHEHALG